MKTMAKTYKINLKGMEVYVYTMTSTILNLKEQSMEETETPKWINEALEVVFYERRPGIVVSDMIVRKLKVFCGEVQEGPALWFPYVWKDDREGKVYLTASDGYKAYLYSEEGWTTERFQGDGLIKETFPFPPLWRIFRKKTDIVIYPHQGEDIPSLIKVQTPREEALMWWNADAQAPNFTMAYDGVLGRVTPFSETIEEWGTLSLEVRKERASIISDEFSAVVGGKHTTIRPQSRIKGPIKVRGDLSVLTSKEGDAENIVVLRNFDEEKQVGWFIFRLEAWGVKEYYIFPMIPH